MERIAKRSACYLLCLALVACGGLPKSKEISGDNPSFLEVVHAPEGAQVWSDGIMLGATEKKRARFVIASGNHSVKIMSGAGVLYEREVFVEKGTTRQIQLKPK